MSLRKLSCYKEVQEEHTETSSEKAISSDEEISRNIVEVLLTKVEKISHNCFEAGLKLRTKVPSEVLYKINVKSDKPGHGENDHHFSACPVTGENCNYSHTFDLNGAEVTTYFEFGRQ